MVKSLQKSVSIQAGSVSNICPIWTWGARKRLTRRDGSGRHRQGRSLNKLKISHIKFNMPRMKLDMSYMKSEMQHLKFSMSQTKLHLWQMKFEASSFKCEISCFKLNMSYMRCKIPCLKLNI